MLRQLGRLEEALATGKGLTSEFGGGDPRPHEAVAGGLLNQCLILHTQRRYSDLERSADELVDRFADDPLQGSKRRNVVAHAMGLKAVSFSDQGRRDEEVAQWSRVIDRFGDGRELDVQRWFSKRSTRRGISSDSRDN